jgi:DnaK suppressor protein
MTPADRDAMARRLHALRVSLLERTPTPIEPNRADVATAGVADEDAQALNEMQQVLASNRNLIQAEALARIDRALARLTSDPDLFGLCEECEEEIPLARLETIPDATLCTECQAKRDPQRNARRRSTSDFSR